MRFYLIASLVVPLAYASSIRGTGDKDDPLKELATHIETLEATVRKLQSQVYQLEEDNRRRLEEIIPTECLADYSNGRCIFSGPDFEFNTFVNFEDRASFDSETDFQGSVRFGGDDVEFDSETTFEQEATFEDVVIFDDLVEFHHDVLMEGPDRRRDRRALKKQQQTC